MIRAVLLLFRRCVAARAPLYAQIYDPIRLVGNIRRASGQGDSLPSTSLINSITDKGITDSLGGDDDVLTLDVFCQSWPCRPS